MGALIAAALVAGGGAVLVIEGTQRDSDGYLMSPATTLAGPSHAFVSERMVANLDGPAWLYRDEQLGTVRLRVSSDQSVFLGIARDADVQRYLGGVDHEVVRGFGAQHRGDDRVPGGAPGSAPGSRRIWVASTEGAGDRALTWKVRDGAWSVVLMNADGSPGVAARVRTGARLESLDRVGAGMLGVGVVGLCLAALAIGVSIRATRVRS